MLDCSVAVAWCFEDEATPELDALLDRVQHEGAVVPSFWISEAANVLLMAHRRGRINKETMQERVALLDMLPIETDDMALIDPDSFDPALGTRVVVSGNTELDDDTPVEEAKS